VEVFDNTPAGKDATLEAGDELVGINGKNVKVRRYFLLTYSNVAI
jgi:C-terminal processing protease CtpA/Prc